jgi:hypothetical protein
MPFDVPITMHVETAKQVGLPKFLFPASENTWPVNLRSFAHRIVSHAARLESKSGKAWKPALAREDCLECVFRKPGECARGKLSGEGARRD